MEGRSLLKSKQNFPANDKKEASITSKAKVKIDDDAEIIKDSVVTAVRKRRGRPKGARSCKKSETGAKNMAKRRRKPAKENEPTRRVTIELMRPVNIRQYLVHRPFATEDEKTLEMVRHETFLTKFNPYKIPIPDPDPVVEESDLEDDKSEDEFHGFHVKETDFDVN